MEIHSIKNFIKYYQQTREITNRVINTIPADKMDWTYQTGKFSIADLVRHIAAIERNVFMEVIRGNKSTYKGCGKELADGYEAIMLYFNEMHRQSLEVLHTLTDEDLAKEVRTLDGRTTSTRNFLRALPVHEIHHRGALCIYLNLIGVSTPPVIGLREEQVIQLSK